MILHKIKSYKGFILEVLLNVLIILAIVALVRHFLIVPFIVKGESMMNSYVENEYIIIDKISYRLRPPKRGDVVVFLPPLPDVSDYYIKRVIGLPGETIKIQNGYVHLCKTPQAEDCHQLDESTYLTPENLGHTCTGNNITYNCPNEEEVTIYEIPPESYFLLGDNRRKSCDSRSFSSPGGCQHISEKTGTYYVPQQNIEGRSVVAFWPFNKLGLISGPTYEIPSEYLTPPEPEPTPEEPNQDNNEETTEDTTPTPEKPAESTT